MTFKVLFQSIDGACNSVREDQSPCDDQKKRNSRSNEIYFHEKTTLASNKLIEHMPFRNFR